MAPCPDETPACQDGTYVVPGDSVLTGDSNGDYICAFFPNRFDTAGYIRRDELVAVPQLRTLPVTAWAGTWVDGDDTVTMRVRNGKLTVDGEAFWPSRNPPRDVSPGGPHTGSVTGIVLPKDRVLLVHERGDDCEVHATLMPPFLIVDDNNECGGMNVTFRGLYRRR